MTYIKQISIQNLLVDFWIDKVKETNKNYMTKKMFSLLLSFISISCFGQIMLQNHVLATCGKTYSNATISMEYTLGEPFTKTLSATTVVETQGFHQPNLKLISHVGVQEISNFNLNVYPNPFLNQFTIALPSNEIVYITIYDVMGKLIHEQTLGDIENVIDLGFLASGNYRISYKTENQIQTGNISIIKYNL